MKKLLFAIAILTILLCISCSDNELSSMEKLAKGAELYEKHCANCHQKDGKGLANLFPPLLNSDYLIKHQDKLTCMIRNGIAGELMVNNKNYNLQMPGNPILTAHEIAILKSFVLQKFSKQSVSFSDSLVSLELKNCVN